MNDHDQDRPLGLTLDLVAVACAASAVVLLAGSLLLAVGQFERYRDVEDKLHLLGNAANPLIGALLLAAVAITVVRKSPKRVAAVSAGAAFVMGVLALNGVVLDLTQPGNGTARLGSIVFRVGTLLLSAAAVWLWFAMTGGLRPDRGVELGRPQVIERPLAEGRE